MSDPERRFTEWAEHTIAITPAEEHDLRVYWEVYSPLAERIHADLTALLSAHEVWGPLVRSMTPAQARADNERSLGLQRDAILERQWPAYLDDCREQGIAYARLGVGFADWFDVTSRFRAVTSSLLFVAVAGDLERLAACLTGMNKLLDMAMATLGEAYLGAKEEVIGKQQDAIRELSTPVLQIRDRLLMLPVIGILDTFRARQLTQQLLKSIRETRAKAAVMDITGVPAVDSRVANHLLQTIAAAKLMGTTVVVTGISSDVAQALVALGVDLGGLATVGDLQEGLETAERLLRSAPLEAT